MMEKRRVLMTHYDLDGVSCDLLMSKLFKFEKKYQGGYIKVKERIDQGDMKGYDSAVVTDISLTPEQFADISDEYKDKFLYVDHHNPSVKLVRGLKNNPSKCIVTEKFCATGLILQSFRQLHKENGIFSYVAAVDAYDCWRHELHPKHFDIGYDLNILFWKYGYFKFYDRFSKNFSLKWDGIESQWIKSHKVERDKVLKESDKTEFGNNSLVVLDTPDGYINDYTLHYPDYNFYFMIYTNTDDKIVISVRSKVDYISIGDILREVREEFHEIITAGGHREAGGIDFYSTTSLEVLLDVIEHVNGRFEELMVPF